MNIPMLKGIQHVQEATLSIEYLKCNIRLMIRQVLIIGQLGELMGQPVVRLNGQDSVG